MIVVYEALDGITWGICTAVSVAKYAFRVARAYLYCGRENLWKFPGWRGPPVPRRPRLGQVGLVDHYFVRNETVSGFRVFGDDRPSFAEMLFTRSLSQEHLLSASLRAEWVDGRTADFDVTTMCYGAFSDISPIEMLVVMAGLECALYQHPETVQLVVDTMSGHHVFSGNDIVPVSVFRP